MYRCRASRSWAFYILLLLPFVLLVKDRSPPFLVAAAAAAAIYLLDVYIPIYVDLGPEGVSFSRLGRRRLVPYREIASVEVRERAGVGNVDKETERTKSWTIDLSVVFNLQSGGTIEVGTGSDEVPVGNHTVGAVGSYGATDKISRALTREVRMRLRELCERDVASLEEALLRGGRSVSDWLAELSRLVDQQGHAYRAATVDKEALWAVLEDPAAKPSARAGAAIVLRKMLAPDDAARVRVAVERCELPRLRVALEHALSEEDDASDAYRESIGRIE